jgi:hypothetical protein
MRCSRCGDRQRRRRKALQSVRVCPNCAHPNAPDAKFCSHRAVALGSARGSRQVGRVEDSIQVIDSINVLDHSANGRSATIDIQTSIRSSWSYSARKEENFRSCSLALISINR